ncbi:hypothetical protein L484_004997 [Morus notabilis]|uniref:Uncharacterized protein n=1 Tax=Morus notabilis TaxID=981085 RepID=W9S6V8_9ROSA|nr:hypothetical protein L484_004997 [Morus notabilis]
MEENVDKLEPSLDGQHAVRKARLSLFVIHISTSWLAIDCSPVQCTSGQVDELPHFDPLKIDDSTCYSLT